jgi:hypothetical protein
MVPGIVVVHDTAPDETANAMTLPSEDATMTLEPNKHGEAVSMLPVEMDQRNSPELPLMQYTNPSVDAITTLSLASTSGEETIPSPVMYCQAVTPSSTRMPYAKLLPEQMTTIPPSVSAGDDVRVPKPDLDQMMSPVTSSNANTVPAVDAARTRPFTVIQTEDLNAPDEASDQRVVTTGPGGPESRESAEWSPLRRNCCQMGSTDGVIDGDTDDEYEREEVAEMVGEADSETVDEDDEDDVPPKAVPLERLNLVKTIANAIKSIGCMTGFCAAVNQNDGTGGFLPNCFDSHLHDNRPSEAIQQQPWLTLRWIETCSFKINTRCVNHRTLMKWTKPRQTTKMQLPQFKFVGQQLEMYNTSPRVPRQERDKILKILAVHDVPAIELVLPSVEQFECELERREVKLAVWEVNFRQPRVILDSTPPPLLRF